MSRLSIGLALGCTAALLAHASSARAQASLTAADAEISEGSYALTIDVHGLTASVEARQTIVNLGDHDAEAFYDFELPDGATIDDLRIAIPGAAEERAFGVDAAAAGTPGPELDGPSRPDVGLLEMVTGPRDPADADSARYRLTVYPVPAGKAVTLRMHWSMPVTYADGRLLLSLPDRGDAANLSRETGVLRLHPLPGLTDYQDIHADGVKLAARAGGKALAFGHDRGKPLALEATPVFTTADPHAWLIPTSLGGDRRAVALHVMVPRTTGGGELPFERVLVVVDTSRSMDGAQDAATHVVEAIFAAARPSAQIDAIFFDRTARGGKRWRPNTPATRAAIAAELRGASLENGTALTDAMSLAGATIGDPRDGLDGPRDRTLVVAITDGLVPRDATGLELVQRLGDVHVDRQLSFVLLAPPGSALPDPLHGPLADAAGRTGGMVVATRADEAIARAATMATELGQAAPLRALEVTGLDMVQDMELPDAIPAGQGVALTGWFVGRGPTGARIRGQRGNRAVGTAAAPTTVAALGPWTIGLAETHAFELAGGTDDRGPADADLDSTARAIHALQRRERVVTASTSLVVVDRRAPFARERQAIAAAGGPFTRLAPPGEVAAQRRAIPPQVRIGQAVRRGDLDKQLIHSMIDTGLLPRARACFQPLLLSTKTAAGTVHLELELARGEITRARAVPPSDFSLDIQRCIVEAAYQMNVPRVAPGDEPDTVTIVNYPLSFRSLAAQELILPGDADAPDALGPDMMPIEVDAENPLGGIPVPP